MIMYVGVGTLKFEETSAGAWVYERTIRNVDGTGSVCFILILLYSAFM
jgi:hypothetical protein